MTRIIAGSARGRRLKVPPAGTRPTTDRVRESMFATLDHMLGGFSGLRVLDLFAGSGALGLEAASRGATEVLLVERDRASAAVARANAGVVGAPGTRVVASPVSAFLSGAPSEFDLVLADPPYAVTAAEVEAVLARLVAGLAGPGRRGRRRASRSRRGVRLARRARGAAPTGVRGDRPLVRSACARGRGPMMRKSCLPGILRPGDQRPHRRLRPRGGALRRGDRRGPGQQEQAVAVHRRGAHRAARARLAARAQHPHRQLPRPARRLLPRARDHRDRQGPAGGSPTSTTSCRWPR